MGRKTKKQMARKSKGGSATVGPVVFDEAQRLSQEEVYRRVGELKDQGYGNPVLHTRESIPAAAARRAQERQMRSQMPKTAKTGVQQPRKSAAQSDQAQAFMESLRQFGDRIKNQTPQDAEKAQAVRRRLEALMQFLQKEPVPILDQLRALGIAVKVCHNVPEQPQYDTVVLLLREIQAADAKIKSEGTLYDQLYKGQVP